MQATTTICSNALNTHTINSRPSVLLIGSKVKFQHSSLIPVSFLLRSGSSHYDSYLRQLCLVLKEVCIFSCTPKCFFLKIKSSYYDDFAESCFFKFPNIDAFQNNWYVIVTLQPASIHCFLFIKCFLVYAVTSRYCLLGCATQSFSSLEKAFTIFLSNWVSYLSSYLVS